MAMCCGRVDFVAWARVPAVACREVAMCVSRSSFLLCLAPPPPCPCCSPADLSNLCLLTPAARRFLAMCVSRSSSERRCFLAHALTPPCLPPLPLLFPPLTSCAPVPSPPTAGLWQCAYRAPAPSAAVCCRRWEASGTRRWTEVILPGECLLALGLVKSAIFCSPGQLGALGVQPSCTRLGEECYLV